MSRIQLVRAPNPSAMTLSGTNSYLIDAGGGEALVIDPGPIIERHLEALLAAARERNLRITAIALTHGHPDHAPAAAPLARATGARIYAHPTSIVPHDEAFALDGTLRIRDLALDVVDAPGHTFDHVAFFEPAEGALFTGDVILGEGTVVIAPPSGAMRPYQRTLAMLGDRFGDARRIYGGHGPAVEDPRSKIAEYIAHRALRERELIEALEIAPQTIPELVLRIYGPGRAILWPAMARQMLAYLIALAAERRVEAVAVDRAMTDEETAILNPPWEAIVGIEHAALIAEELGSMLRLDRLYRYSVTRSAG
ncbi:MAG TPA: MBL fold metallo-hydrolase [Candidatus Dormibacteraeota bacterium]|nr:MBL fold metallo-hydrolase [Candidatus Dormibacteraeota bacterium]